MIRLDRLHVELTAAGLPVAGLAEGREPRPAAGPATWVPKDGAFVRVDWASAPSSAQEAQAGAIVAAHDGAPTPAERLAGEGGDRLAAALALRMSAAWASATAQERTRVQAVIDEKGAEVLGKLRS